MLADPSPRNSYLVTNVTGIGSGSAVGSSASGIGVVGVVGTSVLVSDGVDETGLGAAVPAHPVRKSEAAQKRARNTGRRMGCIVS
jgi:hypothetical protein